MQRVSLPLFALCVLLLTCGMNKARADVYEDYDIGTGFDNYHNNPDIDSRRTDHMLFRFGPTPKDGAVSEQRAQGHMQMLESCYDTWRRLGLHDMGGTASGHKYRAIENPANTYPYDGPMGCVSFDVGPRVTGIHAPTGYFDYFNNNGSTPHEMGHGWWNSTVGHLPGTKMSEGGDWSESFANWLMSLYTADSPSCGLSVGYTGGHSLQRYNSYAFYDYFMDTPAFGANFINSWAGGATANLSTDDFIGKAIRVDTSGNPDHLGTIYDAFGMANAKTLDYDFWNRRVQRSNAYYLDSGHEYFFFNRIKMVRQPGVTDAWYRPEWTLIPQQFSNNYIPLTITATGSPRTVTCDFRPVSDAVGQTAFRACFVAFNANKEPRYSNVWSAGEKSFTLADDETSVYLAVFACPRVVDQGISFNNYTLNNVAMMPYRIKLTGASPKDWTFPAPTSGFHLHSKGLGKVADTATVDSSAYVGPNAMVLGTAKVYGNSRIEDYAVVDSNATIGRSGQADDPVISGHAYVTGSAQVYGHAKVRDYSWVFGSSKVYGNAVTLGHTMLNGASIYGNAVMSQAPIRDTGMAFGSSDNISGYAVIGGDIGGSSGVGTCTKGVYCHYNAWDTTDNQNIYAAYCFEKKHSIFAMDRWGMNHGYLMGEPLVVSDSVNSTTTNVLSLNGTDQYIEAKPDIVDFPDLTISAWVKWTGTANDQKIFSFGNGTDKVMYLTPKDAGTGKLRFIIQSGATIQALEGTAALPASTWTHVAVTLSGNTGTLYVNGSQVAQNTAMTLNPDQLHAALMADANYIGRGNTDNYFQGRIDEFRVYTTGLDATGVASVKADVIAGTASAADTTAPTPNAATWVSAPAVVSDTDIAISATEGSDAGGNGVLYYFRCVNDSTHDSGWISDNKFTDCKCAPGTTYTYTVKMKDKLGNTGSESGPQAATTPAMDTAAPTPNPPTFASAPKGSGTNAITMTATKGNDSDQIVMYKFSRVGGTATSGWTSSRTWTDTGLTSGSSYSYTLQMKDGHNNTTSTTTSASTVAVDNTAPVLDTDYRLQWKRMPYTRLDKTVRMVARKLAETDVEYYFECVENTSINSSWTSNNTWLTPALPDGTWTFHFKIRDRSAQLNTTGWSSTLTSKVTTTNSWHDYTINQLASLPDDTLVRFTGKVTQVNTTNYIVSSTDGSISIKVRPRTFGNATHAELLNKTVSVQGHLWTYTGDAKMVTYAQVVSSPISGRVEVEDGELGDGVTPRNTYGASGYEYANVDTVGDSVKFVNVAAATQITVANRFCSQMSLYINGLHAQDLVFSGGTGGDGFSLATMSVNIPQGATVELKHDTGDTAGWLDYIVFGTAYTISGTVTDNTAGGAIAANARVYFATTPNAVAKPAFVATTDSFGNYYARIPAGTWYASAGSEINYIQIKSSTEQSTSVGPDKTGFNFQLNWSSGRTGKIEAETATLYSYAYPFTDMNCSGNCKISSFWDYAAMEFNNIAATNQITVGYSDGGGILSLYVNGAHSQDLNFPTTGGWREESFAVNIPDHATIKIKHDVGDTASPSFDYIIVPGGPTVSVSGFVRDSNGVAIPGATVESKPSLGGPTKETVTTDASGHYSTSQNIPSGLWYLKASKTGYVSGTRSITAAGTNITNMDITLNNPVSTIRFAKKDTTTQGSWKGVYGADGYNVVRDVTSYPSYATVTRVDGSGDYLWSGSTTETRGLQKVNSTTDRIGAGWNSGQIVFDVNFTDGNTHQITLYFVDWDNTNRRQTVEVLDADKKSVIDIQNLNTAFNNGAWLVWEIKGSVRFRVTCTGGANAVINGLFFDPVTYTINASAGSGGIISPSGAVPANAGLDKTFVITPNTGYSISDVIVDNQSKGAVASYTFPAVSANHTISATFAATQTSNKYEAEAAARAGSVDIRTGSWASGGQFVGNVGGNTSNTLTFTVNASSAGSRTMTMEYQTWGTRTTYVSVNGGTGVALSCPQVGKADNANWGSASMTVTLNAGTNTIKMYNNTDWAPDIDCITFLSSQCTITASAGANGAISPSGPVAVNSGTNKTFTITPSAGYIVSGVNVDNVSQGAITSYTFTNVTVDHTISATFAPQISMKYEAEAAARAGGVDIRTGTWASGGQFVGGVGSGSANTVTFTVNSATSGNTTMTMDYQTWGTRTTYVSVNGGAGVALSCPQVGKADNANWGSASMTINLNAGTNTIKMYNNTDWAPDIDCITLPTNLVAYYKFDETSGTSAADSSGNGKTGTLYGTGATWAAGKTNNAVNLDGVNGYVSLPTGIVSNLSDFSIATWVKLDANNVWNRLFDFGTGTGTYMDVTPQNSAGKVEYAIRYNNGTRQTVAGTAALPTGSWQHVVVTQSGNVCTLYVNGAVVGTNTNMTLNPSSLGNTTLNYIGKSQYTNPFLDGLVDGFRIYNKALSPSEISALYNSGAGVASIDAPAPPRMTVFSASVDPIIDLSAAGLESGVLPEWRNTGTAGGTFVSDGTTPVVETIDGVKAVTFSGEDWMTASSVAPSTITGDHAFTTSVWAYRPIITRDETILSWATNAQIYAGPIPAGGWHLLTVSYDKTNLKLYVDGVLISSEKRSLNTTPGMPMILGAAYTTEGSTYYPTLNFTGSIGSVKVFDRALGQSEITNIYEAGF